MKKLILLSSLIVTLNSMAEITNSSVELYNKNLIEPTNSDLIFGAKTEITIPNHNLSLGADIQTKYSDSPIASKDFTLKNSSAWIKYELPQLHNTSTYIKAFYDKYDYFKYGVYHVGTFNKISIQADTSHKIKDKLQVGLNSTTDFHLNNIHINSIIGDRFTSTHKVYIKGDYSVIKDIYAELGLNHDYYSHKEPNPLDDNHALKTIFLNANASYKNLKDIKLNGEVKFAYNLDMLNNSYKFESTFFKIGNELIGDFSDNNFFMQELRSYTYAHHYALTGTYTGLKNTEITIKPIIEHTYSREVYAYPTRIAVSGHTLSYGTNIDVKYTGINNLTFSSKNLFMNSNFFEHNHSVTPEIYQFINLVLIKLNANVEYAYKLNNKLTFKPSLDLTNATLVNFFSFDKTTIVNDVLNISPKIAIEYKPHKNLTISGNLSPVVVFDNGRNNIFRYNKTAFKTDLNIKYTW